MRVETVRLWRFIGTLTAAVYMNLQTLLRIVIEIPVRLRWIAKAKVIGPTLEIPIKLLNQIRYGLETHPAAGHRSQRGPFLHQRLLRREYIQVTIGATETVAIVPKRVA